MIVRREEVQGKQRYWEHWTALALLLFFALRDGLEDLEMDICF